MPDKTAGENSAVPAHTQNPQAQTTPDGHAGTIEEPNLSAIYNLRVDSISPQRPPTNRLANESTSVRKALISTNSRRFEPGPSSPIHTSDTPPVPPGATNPHIPGVKRSLPPDSSTSSEGRPPKAQRRTSRNGPSSEPRSASPNTEITPIVAPSPLVDYSGGPRSFFPGSSFRAFRPSIYLQHPTSFERTSALTLGSQSPSERIESLSPRRTDRAIPMDLMVDRGGHSPSLPPSGNSASTSPGASPVASALPHAGEMHPDSAAVAQSHRSPGSLSPSPEIQVVTPPHSLIALPAPLPQPATPDLSDGSSDDPNDDDVQEEHASVLYAQPGSTLDEIKEILLSSRNIPTLKKAIKRLIDPPSEGERGLAMADLETTFEEEWLKPRANCSFDFGEEVVMNQTIDDDPTAITLEVDDPAHCRNTRNFFEALRDSEIDPDDWYTYMMDNEERSFKQLANNGTRILRELAAVVETQVDGEARKRLRVLFHRINQLVVFQLRDRLQTFEDAFAQQLECLTVSNAAAKATERLNIRDRYISRVKRLLTGVAGLIRRMQVELNQSRTQYSSIYQWYNVLKNHNEVLQAQLEAAQDRLAGRPPPLRWRQDMTTRASAITRTTRSHSIT